MCGLTGFIDLTRSTSADELRSRVTAMADALRHRGPDDAGVWVDAAAGVALGHRRLSILDLSPLGHQPMFSHDGRWGIVYNGEIYNHGELRRDLQQRGVQFKSTSDTETLVEGFSAWGVRETVQRCRGIFAIAAYDIPQRELTLVRDHLGVKPLYYGRQGDTWLFGSELKALRAHPAFAARIDRNVLPQYLRHNYVPGPYTIYENIHKLPAGTLLTFPVMDAAANPQPEAYWSFTETALTASKNPWSGSFAEIVDRVQSELSRSVSEQMLADVPLGAFLSGGIDSSLVVALMQSQSARPVKTFTIGFELADYNEAPFAHAVAKHLGTDHTEHYVTAEQARDVIPRLPSMFDEPFADSSQIPTFLVSELARRHVTVSLSGDGGDELFCGYLRYFAPLLGSKAGYIPTVVRSPLSFAVRMAGQFATTTKSRKFLNRAASFLADADPDDRYLRGMSHWALNEFVVRDAHPVNTMFMSRENWPKFAERQQRWMWLDTLNYLPDDILVKVDRASMAVSLEARVPLLDPGVVAAAWSVPFAMQTQGWTGKQVLRSVLEKFVPRSMFERPKKGFGVPIAEWLRGPLRDWAEALLSEHRLQSEGYFYAAPIRQKWAEHQSGRVDWAYHLWDVLMFQAWLAEVEGRRWRVRIAHRLRLAKPPTHSVKQPLAIKNLKEQSRMFDFLAKWSDGLSYTEFLNRFATEEQRRRWDAVFAQVTLTAEQTALLKSFRRRMIVPIMAGTWCGDCVQQCPIFAHIAAANPLIEIRYFDRDTHLDMADAVRICGGRRVPTVIFLSEEGAFCGLQGDRTITKYRELVAALDGATCPTGLVGPSAGVVQDWINEFERVQAMVRLSPRLREKHGD